MNNISQNRGKNDLNVHTTDSENNRERPKTENSPKSPNVYTTSTSQNRKRPSSVKNPTLLPKRPLLKSVVKKPHNPKPEILMISDSMLKCVKVENISEKIALFAFPGVTFGQLAHQIDRDVLPPRKDISRKFSY